MQNQPQEIFIIIAIGALIGLLLVVFVLFILYQYQRRRNKQEKEIILLNEQHEKDLLNSQISMQEDIFKQAGEELHHHIKNDILAVQKHLTALRENVDNYVSEKLLIAENSLEKSISDIRNIAYGLYLKNAGYDGLLDSIRDEVARFNNISLVPIECTIDAQKNYFSDQISNFLLRMIQECLQNTLKHANASLINIHVYENEHNFFVVDIVDNGCGFNVEMVRKENKRKGIGVASMYSRCHLIGADLHIESNNEGTRVVITMPIPIVTTEE